MKKITLSLLIFFFSLSVYAQQRLVLIEQFSNASCPICANYSLQVYTYADQNPAKAVVITYHAPFPYQHDSFHFVNPGDANARINFYGVNGTPTTVIDGNFQQGPTANILPALAAKVDERRQVAPLYGIIINNLHFANNEVEGTAVYTAAADNSAAHLSAYVVLVEKSVPKSVYQSSPGSNAETEYKNVMRYLYPSSQGETIFQKQNGQTHTIDFTFSTTNVKLLGQMRVIAFVQNDSTKEILQTAYADLPATLAKPEINRQAVAWTYSPDENTYILTRQEDGEALLTLTDIAGRQVTAQYINGTTGTINVTGLESGIYLATLTTLTGRHTTKLWLW